MGSPNNSLYQGPFSAQLAPIVPETPRLNPNTPPTKAGGAFFLASKFLEGAAQAKARSFAQKEQKKQEYVDNLNRKVQEVMSDPKYTDEQKHAYIQAANNAIGPHINETLKKSDSKKNPVLGAAKSLWDGLTGGKYESTKPDPQSIQDFMAGAGENILRDPKGLKATYASQLTGTFDQVLAAQPPGTPVTFETLRNHPDVIRAINATRPYLGDQGVNDIVSTYTGARQKEPAPGSVEAIRAGMQKKYGQPQTVPPPGAPGSTAQQQNALPPLAPGSAPIPTAEPPLPRSSTATQRPAVSDQQILADMTEAGWASKPTSGISNGKDVNAVYVNNPLDSSLNGYRDANTGKLLPNFSPVPKAGEEPKYEKGEQTEINGKVYQVYVNPRNPKESYVDMDHPVYKAPKATKGGGGGGEKPLTPAQKLNITNSYKAALTRNQQQADAAVANYWAQLNNDKNPLSIKFTAQNKNNNEETLQMRQQELERYKRDEVYGPNGIKARADKQAQQEYYQSIAAVNPNFVIPEETTEPPKPRVNKEASIGKQAPGEVKASTEAPPTAKGIVPSSDPRRAALKAKTPNMEAPDDILRKYIILARQHGGDYTEAVKMMQQDGYR